MTGMNGPTGMMVIQGNHLEALRDVMTGWIKRYPLPPLEDEQILVQSNGIAQWLKMALAQDDVNGGCGIAAAMNVQLPGRFLWQGYRHFQPDIPAASPFDKAPLTWTLYQLLSDIEQLKQSVENPEILTPLLGFLQQDADPRRTHQLAGKLADLYDQYQVYRSDWLAAWDQGKDVLIKLGKEPPEQPIDEEQRWQPELWRLVTRTIQASVKVSDVDLDTGASGAGINGAGLENDTWALKSRAAVHRAIVERCQTLTQAPEELPKRVIVFGISALPYTVLEFLQSIAKFSQVLLFVHNPSPHYWGDLIEGKALLKQYSRIRERKLPEGLPLDQLHLQGNPLLASWGKQGRDYLHLLDENDQPEQYKAYFNSIDLFEPPLFESSDDPSSLPRSHTLPLLKQLQDDIYQLRSLDERKQLSEQAYYQINPEEDQSLQFIVAHSPQREMEILHDQLLNEFEKNGHLNPRDILVMVPDINVYAPHIQAVFGRYQHPDANGKYDKRKIPFHVSDQSQRGRNSLLIAFETLLGSKDARFSVSELLDLLDTPALLARFGLEPDNLVRLHQWIKGANIRWGLDSEHRQEIGLGEAKAQNTWLFGLQRMLLGYATGQTASWQNIEPYDEVAGLEAGLLGPLVLLVERIMALRINLQQPKSPKDWEVELTQLCEAFFTAQDKGDLWAIESIRKALESWREACELAQAEDLSIPLEVARDELMANIDQPTLTQKFLGGAVNFATLMPMRAIPFEQIWMLGMNDSDYPRSQKIPDFDLMGDDYRPGDRSRREDDRYLFLEALLSVRQKLVISWVGRNIRDNSFKPPSVLVGQLRDYLQAGWRLSNGQPFIQALTTEHPLQPFSREYFKPDAKSKRLFTYANEWRQIHNALEPNSTGVLAMPSLTMEANLTLKDLADFLRHPLKSFYKQRLGVSWFDDGETAEDDETFNLDGLGQWHLHSQIVEQFKQQQVNEPNVPAEQHLQQAFDRLRGSGSLPIGGFAALIEEGLRDDLLAPCQYYASLREAFPVAISSPVYQLEVAPNITLEGQVLDCYQAHQNDLSQHSVSDAPDSEEAVRIILQPSNLFKAGEKKYYHLVKFWPEHLLAQLSQPTRTYLFGAKSESPVCFSPMESGQAKDLLLDLARGWVTGMQAPIPLACKTAFKALFEAKNVASTYEGAYKVGGEISDHPGYARLWPDFESLVADGRFAELSQTLYQPILDNLKLTNSDQDMTDSKAGRHKASFHKEEVEK
jgi:exodeoxyribonuclease V gamma subunit